LRELRLRGRRAELERVVENDHTLIFPARRLAANGLDAWAQVLEAGYERLVGKDDSSPYTGGRTLKWLKSRSPVIGKASGVGRPRRKRSPPVGVLM